jgi:FMN phosphatase YigB (HAD superfamily)
VKAVVAGKPSPDFFRQAVDLLGMPAERVAMVGDDLQNDVLAAQAIGLAGVLVRPGKSPSGPVARPAGMPDHVIGSIAELPGALGPR